jgi:hypothetical protein
MERPDLKDPAICLGALGRAHSLACIIHEGTDTKGLICYKHVDKTVFA